MIASMSGLLVATVLGVALTPRPRHIVSLPAPPEGTHIQFCFDEGISPRADRFIPLELERDWDGDPSVKRYYFLDTLEYRVISHDFDPDYGWPAYFDTEGRFLLPEWHDQGLAAIHWFKPLSQQSGRITIPPFDARQCLRVSGDCSIAVQVNEKLDVRVFDLHAERVRSSFSLDALQFGDCVLSHDGSTVAFNNKLNEDKKAVSLFDTSTGERRGSSRSFSHFIYSDTFKTTITAPSGIDDRAPHLSSWTREGQFMWECRGMKYRVLTADGEMLWESTQAKPIHDGLWVIERTPQLVSGTTGMLSTPYVQDRGKPSSLERFIMHLPRQLGILPPEGSGDGYCGRWTDWSTGETWDFRIPSQRQELNIDPIVRANQIFLLVDEYGPDTRVEVWDAPPRRLPSVAIACTSLLTMLATLIYARRKLAKDVGHIRATDQLNL